VTSSGLAFSKIGIATNRRRKDKSGNFVDETVFVDVTAFGKTAETITKFVGKGDPLYIEGRLNLEQWTDKQGKQKSKLGVVVDSFQFVGGKDPSSQPRQSRDPDGYPKSTQRTNPNPTYEPPADRFGDEDVPF
jgi:single-strand DNA-binding protein